MTTTNDNPAGARRRHRRTPALLGAAALVTAAATAVTAGPAAQAAGNPRTAPGPAERKPAVSASAGLAPGGRAERVAGAHDDTGGVDVADRDPGHGDDGGEGVDVPPGTVGYVRAPASAFATGNAGRPLDLLLHPDSGKLYVGADNIPDTSAVAEQGLYALDAGSGAVLGHIARAPARAARRPPGWCAGSSHRSPATAWSSTTRCAGWAAPGTATPRPGASGPTAPRTPASARTPTPPPCWSPRAASCAVWTSPPEPSGGPRPWRAPATSPWTRSAAPPGPWAPPTAPRCCGASTPPPSASPPRPRCRPTS
ncbi:hypothetical protein ACFQ60_38890 [Streptomyces zhihengii]